MILIRFEHAETAAPPKMRAKPKKSRGWRPHDASQKASSSGCDAE
jgi:hypothetical protein